MPHFHSFTLNGTVRFK